MRTDIIASLHDGAVTGYLAYDDVDGTILEAGCRNRTRGDAALVVKNEEYATPETQSTTMGKQETTDRTVPISDGKYHMVKNDDGDWVLPTGFEFGASVMNTLEARG